MDNDDIINSPVVDLRAVAAQKAAERERAEREKPKFSDGGQNTEQVYEIRYNNGDVDQQSGVLMLTGSFFALGVPTETGVNFNWAAPVEGVLSVTAIDDDDLTEDVAG